MLDNMPNRKYNDNSKHKRSVNQNHNQSQNQSHHSHGQSDTPKQASQGLRGFQGLRNRRGGKSRLSLAASALAISALLLSGCTYESGDKTFHNVTSGSEAPTAENAAEILQTALDTTLHSEKAQKFWYQGWVGNDIQKRRTNSMFDGVVVRPHGYFVNARLVAQPYRYYKWDDHYYIYTEKNDWTRVENEQLPFDPLEGFLWWEPFLDQAKQLPNQPILSKDCQVFQVKLNGKEFLENSNSPLFEDLRNTVANTPGMDLLLEQSTVKMTIWVGAEDHLVYQYQTWIKMPIPGAGYMDQEVFFRFYKYNDPGIEMKTPEEMAQYDE